MSKLPVLDASTEKILLAKDDLAKVLKFYFDNFYGKEVKSCYVYNDGRIEITCEIKKPVVGPNTETQVANIKAANNIDL